MTEITVSVDNVAVDVLSSDVAVNVGVQQPTVDVATQQVDVNVAVIGATAVDVASTVGVIETTLANPTIAVEVVGGGGGFTEKNFQTVDLVLNGAGTYTIDAGKQFFVLGYTATVAGIRIRGYADAAHRTYDAARPVTEEPLMNGGVLFELVTEIGTYKFSKMVPVYAETSMPLLVESVNGSPIDTSVILSLF